MQQTLKKLTKIQNSLDSQDQIKISKNSLESSQNSSRKNKNYQKSTSARRRPSSRKTTKTLGLPDLKAETEAIQEVLFDQDLPHINQSQLKQQGVESEKIERMTRLDNHEQDEWLFYPESNKKAGWDLFITFILLVSCFKSPYDIAFSTDETIGANKIIDWVIDLLFFVDVVIIFNSGFYDDDI